MSLTKKQMVTLYTNLVRADKFGKMMYSRMMQGKLIGFYHPADGAIAPGVGGCSFLKDDDILFPHHRGHGITHMLSKGIDVAPYVAEHAGKATGCCRGRAAWHYAFPEHNVYGTTAYIGHNFVPVTGFGWAAKRNGKGQVVMNCFGDGAMGTGRSHEGLLMSSIWDLPIVHLCENNGFAIFAEASEMHPTEDMATVAQGLDIPSVVVDGQGRVRGGRGRKRRHRQSPLGRGANVCGSEDAAVQRARYRQPRPARLEAEIPGRIRRDGETRPSHAGYGARIGRQHTDAA